MNTPKDICFGKNCDMRAIRLFLSRLPECLKKDVCWEWTGHLTKGKGQGYGNFVWSFNNKSISHVASRFSYWLFKGSPNGFFVLHKCDNPKCVNPAHLFLGTGADNMRDKIQKGRAIYHRGEECHNVKITEKQALEIRRFLESTPLSYERLGLALGIGTSIIREISLGHTWKHLGPKPVRPAGSFTAGRGKSIST